MNPWENLQLCRCSQNKLLIDVQIQITTKNEHLSKILKFISNNNKWYIVNVEYINQLFLTVPIKPTKNRRSTLINMKMIIYIAVKMYVLYNNKKYSFYKNIILPHTHTWFLWLHCSCHQI